MKTKDSGFEYEIGSATIVARKKSGVMQYTSGGMRIYRIRVESMPGFLTNVYLILDGEPTFIDIGSHSPKAQADLDRGFEVVRQEFNEPIRLSDIQNIFVTHGHGDHFTMLLARADLRGKTIYAHSLDIPAIADYTRHYDKWHRLMGKLAAESGIEYIQNKDDFFAPVNLPVDIGEYRLTEIQDGQEIINGYKVYHTPGHCAGHCCLKIGPIIFLGDHILSSTTPHQTPRQSNGGFGLADYLDSLRKVAAIGPTLGLAGHENIIYPVADRAREIETFHQQRLSEILELCQQEQSLHQLTDAYYQRYPHLIGGVASICEMEGNLGPVGAMEEIKAHVEYLMENKRLAARDNGNGLLSYRSL